MEEKLDKPNYGKKCQEIYAFFISIKLISILRLKKSKFRKNKSMKKRKARNMQKDHTFTLK